MFCLAIKESLNLIKQCALSSTHLFLHAIDVYRVLTMGKPHARPQRSLLWSLYLKAIKDAYFFLNWDLPCLLMFPSSLPLLLELIALHCFCTTQARYLETCVRMNFRRKTFHLSLCGSYLPQFWSVIYSLNSYSHLKILTMAKSFLQDVFDTWTTREKKKQKTYYS